MSAKHRRASKLAAKRSAIAATAVGATAAVGLMGAPAQAAAAPPDYSKAISDYSHALDNFLNASNNVNGSLNSVWGPIANGSGGILPTFGSTFTLSDATNLADLPQILRNLGGLNLPTGVPGTVPDVVLPGGGKIVLPVTSSIPGGQLLIQIADQLDLVLGNPAVQLILDELPPASELINGLEITQSDYRGWYSWKLLGLDGETNFLNTFLQTPSGVSLDLLSIPAVANSPTLQLALKAIVGNNLTDVEILPEGTLPAGTVWVPQGDGTYNFPLGAQLGWWAAAPTAAIKLPAWLTGGDAIDTVISVPVYAAGARLPLNLAEAGVVGANVLLPTANGVYSPVSLTMTNLNTILPFGLTNINVTMGNYVGTNGINVNNGQNLLLVQNPLGIPLPLIYGLGGFNFGVEGVGLTSPSLFGFKLFSDELIQLGDPVGPNSSAGVIPEALLPTDPLSSVITGITGPIKLNSLTNLLGLDAFIKPVMTAFGPVYQVVSAVTLQPLSDFATSQYGPFVNDSASRLLDFSKTLSDRTADLPGAPEQPALLTAADDTGSAGGSQQKIGVHDESNGGENALAMISRINGPSGTVDQGSKGAEDNKDQPVTPVSDPPTPAPAPEPEPAPSTDEPPAEAPSEVPVTQPGPSTEPTESTPSTVEDTQTGDDTPASTDTGDAATGAAA